MRNAITTVITTLLVMLCAWLASWAYLTDSTVREHSGWLKLLINTDGEIRPSTKVEVLEERIDNHLTHTNHEIN